MKLENNLRVVCTGNPNKTGIAHSVASAFDNVQFVSLSNGFDLITTEGQQKFITLVSNCDVFINASYIAPGVQQNLLILTKQSGMQGYIFNIGSIAEYNRWSWYDSNYTNDKLALRESSLNLCTELFKTTHIVVGGFQDADDSNSNRMDPIEIVKMIKYIIESPVHIPLVGIEKIIDKELEEQLNGKI